MQNYQRKDYAYTTWFFLQRCGNHDFNKNPYLNALRLAKYERETIRRDRREVLTVLVPTLISYCDFSPKALICLRCVRMLNISLKCAIKPMNRLDNKAGKSPVR